MKLLNGRFVVAVGVALALVSLIAFSLSSPSVSVGQETDVVVDDDTGDTGDLTAAPPASLPEAGGGVATEQNSSTGTLLVSLLGALGVALVGAGLALNRRRQHVGRD